MNIFHFELSFFCAKRHCWGDRKVFISSSHISLETMFYFFVSKQYKSVNLRDNSFVVWSKKAFSIVFIRRYHCVSAIRWAIFWFLFSLCWFFYFCDWKKNYFLFNANSLQHSFWFLILFFSISVNGRITGKIVHIFFCCLSVAVSQFNYVNSSWTFMRGKKLFVYRWFFIWLMFCCRRQLCRFAIID